MNLKRSLQGFLGTTLIEVTALALSSCTVLLTTTEKYKPDFDTSDTRTEVHKKLGRPKSETRFTKAIPLKSDPLLEGKSKEISMQTMNQRVSSREDFVTWGTYTDGMGGFSRQEGFALISALSLLILEPIIAPFATINWVFGRFERNQISVWYSPSGNYVDQYWKYRSR